MKRADVICIVYAVDESRSFQQLKSHWLPMVRSQRSEIPVVLVGNKIDTRGVDVTNDDLEDQILPLMSDFKQIETCVECSAKTLINVAEAFYFAQKAVLHPTGPLYDSREHTLKDACIRALERMFRLSDKNRDGFLDDDEITAFQLKCFKTPLQHEEIQSIKQILKEEVANGVTDQGITKDGFIFLHKLFIQRGRLETTWTALRAFGYTDNLELRPELLEPVFKVPKDAVVSIGPKGYQFFTDLFKSYDRGDGCLSWEQLDLLFAVTPENPWLILGFPENSLTDERGAITLEGFLAQWAMTTLLNWKVTLEYLAWLGYDDGPTTDALKVVPSGRKKGRAQRDTLLCWMLGAVGSGKTGLCRNFIRRPFESSYMPTLTPYHVVNSVPVEGSEKYLVVEEISSHCGLDQEIIADKSLLAMCDVICYVYDSSDPNSFSHIIKLRKENPELARFPGIVLATKSDKPAVEQQSESGISSAEYCIKEGLQGPFPVSAMDEQTEEVWAKVAQLAMQPAQKNRCCSCNWITWGMATTLVAVGAASAYAAYRWHKHKQP